VRFLMGAAEELPGSQRGRFWLKRAGYEPDMAFTTIPPE
jgi:hypothetical protein